MNVGQQSRPAITRTVQCLKCLSATDNITVKNTGNVSRAKEFRHIRLGTETKQDLWAW